MPRQQNYSDLSKGRLPSSIKEPGIRLCTHTCPVLPSHVPPQYIFANAGSAGPRHNNDFALHPNCHEHCPAHPSNARPRVNEPPTLAEWMELTPEARTWAKQRYGASTPPPLNQLSPGPSSVPPVPTAAAATLEPSAPTTSIAGGSTAFDRSGHDAAPLPAEARIGDFDFSAFLDDEDSNSRSYSDPNMFSASDVPLDDHQPVEPMAISTPNTPAPSSPSPPPLPAKNKKKKVRFELLRSYVSALVNAEHQRVRARRQIHVTVSVLSCSTTLYPLLNPSYILTFLDHPQPSEESEQEGEKHRDDAVRIQSSSNPRETMEVRRMHSA